MSGGSWPAGRRDESGLVWLTNGTVAPPTAPYKRYRIKARAAKFAEDWNGAQYERGDTQTFYIEFFELFRVPRRRVASVEHGINLPERSAAIAIFFGTASFSPTMSAGRSRTPARWQALDHFPGLKEHQPPPPNPSVAGKSEGPAMPSRQAVTTTIISNDFIFPHADVRK
jgi:hypothetical protein